MIDYNDIKALNWSTLKRLHVSPKYYRWCLDHPEPPKDVYALGSAIHCAVLEPEEFDKRYALCTVRRNKRDKAFQEWLAEHEGMEPLNAAEMQHVQGAAEGVMAHRVAREVLVGCRVEEPLTWDDPDTGIQCKGRADAISSDYIVDLKTALHISPRRFARAAAEHGYHAQLAGMYHVGAKTLRKIDGKVPPFIIALEKEPPYDCAVYQMSLEDMAAGRQLVLSLMERLQECIAADVWPGQVPDLQQLQLPGWAPGLNTEESEGW